MSKTTTIQGTSKSLKLQSVLSATLAILGFFMVMAASSAGGEPSTAGTIMLLAGTAWYFINKVRVWWNHD